MGILDSIRYENEKRMYERQLSTRIGNIKIGNPCGELVTKGYVDCSLSPYKYKSMSECLNIFDWE
jgi:hypothetical protein